MNEQITTKNSIIGFKTQWHTTLSYQSLLILAVGSCMNEVSGSVVLLSLICDGSGIITRHMMWGLSQAVLETPSASGRLVIAISKHNAVSTDLYLPLFTRATANDEQLWKKHFSTALSKAFHLYSLLVAVLEAQYKQKAFRETVGKYGCLKMFPPIHYVKHKRGVVCFGMRTELYVYLRHQQNACRDKAIYGSSMVSWH